MKDGKIAWKGAKPLLVIFSVGAVALLLTLGLPSGSGLNNPGMRDSQDGWLWRASFLKKDEIILSFSKDESDWLRIAETDFTALAKTEHNPWLNDCSKERAKYPTMYNFTKAMTNRLASERRLIREELIEKAGVWTVDECPSIVNFHSHAAAFDLYPEQGGFKEAYPIMTTAYAIRAACQLKIMERIMQKLNSSMVIVSGTHLGAVRSGGMIPWDDDVDVWIPKKLQTAFLSSCEDYKLKGAQLHCWKSWNALKLYTFDDSPKAEFFKSKWPHSSPYVDIFLYDEEMQEAFPDEKVRHNNLVPIRNPLRPWLLSGEVFTGPPRNNSIIKHDLSTCVMSSWNHRFKRGTKSHRLDCCVLREHFAFSYLIEFNHQMPDGSFVMKQLEQTVFKEKVLASTILDNNGIVERMYTIGQHGKLEKVAVPPILPYDP